MLLTSLMCRTALPPPEFGGSEVSLVLQVRNLKLERQAHVIDVGFGQSRATHRKDGTIRPTLLITQLVTF